jgi:hypothetical protein
VKHLLSLMLLLGLAAPVALAEPPRQPQQLPPPLPPQQEQAQKDLPPDKPKNPGKPPEFFKARREALAARKAAQKQRMFEFKAARAAAEQKAYQDWHDRYIADAPVREQYYRTLSSAYLADAALARERAAYYYYSWSPPVFVPVYPIYAPYYQAPIHGTVFWGW